MAVGGAGMARADGSPPVQAGTRREAMEQQRTEMRAGEPVSLEFVAKATLVVIGLWALANLVWLARDVLFITFFALLIASFLSIFVEPLHDRGAKRALAAPLVMIIITLCFAALFVLAWPTLREQFAMIQQELPPALERLQAWMDEQFVMITGSIGDPGDAVQEQIRTGVGTQVTGLIGGAMPLLNTAVGAMTGFFLVIFAGLFIAISPRTYMRGLIVLVPRSRRRRAGEVLPLAGLAMVQWMKGTALAMLFVGVTASVGLWLIGVPAALALGSLPAAGVHPVLWPCHQLHTRNHCGAGHLAADGALGNRPLRRGAVAGVGAGHAAAHEQMVKLPPALTLLFQTMMAALFGFLGLLLAVPILATSKILIEELWVESIADEH
jgi:predicted PurR-regulated permease PerM